MALQKVIEQGRNVYDILGMLVRPYQVYFLFLILLQKLSAGARKTKQGLVVTENDHVMHVKFTKKENKLLHVIPTTLPSAWTESHSYSLV